MTRIRGLSKMSRDCNWLLPAIIAFAAAILSNGHFCVSFITPLPIQSYRGGNSSPADATRSSSVSSTLLKSSSSGTSWSVRSILSREDAQALLDSPKFLPTADYGDRIGFGRQAAEKEYGENEEEVGIMLSDDPRLTRTYAEFPLESLDRLLDQAVRYLPTDAVATTSSSLNMVDIGSGLGRIVLYSALTRGGKDDNSNEIDWKVHGIEISPTLHSKALEVVQNGIDEDIFQENSQNENDERTNSFSLHCGSATDEAGRKLLADAHLVFSYSTVFKAKAFDPDVGALILDTEEWSLPLSEACPDGCVVVTTDRALNPNLGWKMVERMDVPNPEVFGSTGFIHILEKGHSK